MKVKILKAIIAFAVIFSGLVCYADGNKVVCSTDTDEKNEIAIINVVYDETAEPIGESDIILYISENVKQSRENGALKVAVNLSDGIINEDNLASLVEGIDIISVVNSEKISHMTGNTFIMYVKDSAYTDTQIVTDIEKTENTEENTSEEKNPMDKMRSIVTTTVALLLLSILVLIIIKNKLKK